VAKPLPKSVARLLEIADAPSRVQLFISISAAVQTLVAINTVPQD
jgi:hypothetical protein